MPDNEFALDYEACRRLLLERLQEPAPGRIQLLTGPRQVGKTTLLLDLTKQLGEATRYVAGDDPQAGLPGFWERVWTEAESRAGRGSAILFFEEMQDSAGWCRRLKGQYYRLLYVRIPLHVVATGSSALRVGSAHGKALPVALSD